MGDANSDRQARGAWLLTCVTEAAPGLGDEIPPRAEVIESLDELRLVGVRTDNAGKVARPSREQLQTYQQIIQACFEHGATLPLRFGTLAADRRRAREVLSDGAVGFRAALERARGCVEMGVRVEAGARPDPDVVRRPTAASNGAEYLAARSAQKASDAPRVPAQLKNLLRETYTDANATRSENPVGEFDGPTVCYNFLVHREKTGAFRQGIDAWRPPDTRVVVSGPWPPFSFTGSKP